MACPKILILFFILSRVYETRSLLIVDFKVPALVDVREKVQMVCTYDLEGESFFSLKWYKEESEFFRSVPEFVPRMRTFAVEGVHVLENESNTSVVTLHPLEYKSSGTYRCEVSGSAPHFKVAYRYANMTVLGLPRGNPKITGVEQKYEIGSYVSANCTSPPSHPPAKLNWFINGVKAEEQFVDYYDNEEPENELNLESSTVGLKFQTNTSQSLQTKDGWLSLVCSASVCYHTRSTEVRAKLSDPAKDKYTHGFGNYRRSNDPGFYFFIAFMAILTPDFIFNI